MRIRTVRARPESERWSLKAVQEIVSTPDKPNPKDPTQTAVQPEGRTRGIDFGAKSGQKIDDKNEEAISVSREFKITAAHLQKYGHTPDCLGCKAKLLDMAKRPHSKACRERIETAIRTEYPEAPTLVKRDERHVKWAESVHAAEARASAATATAAATPTVPQPAVSVDSPRRGGPEHGAHAAQAEHDAQDDEESRCPPSDSDFEDAFEDAVEDVQATPVPADSDDDMEIDAEGPQREHDDGRSTKVMSDERSKRRRISQCSSEQGVLRAANSKHPMLPPAGGSRGWAGEAHLQPSSTRRLRSTHS